MRTPKGHVCAGTRRWDYTYPSSGNVVHGYDLDGECVPTVTEICGLLDKGGLPWFYGQNTYDLMTDPERAAEWYFLEPDKARQWCAGAGTRKATEAADLGTAIHDIAERHQRTGVMPAEVTEEQAPFVKSYELWVQEWQPTFRIVEAVVGNHDDRWMGTLDAIVDVGGRTVVIDYKTGGQLHRVDPHKPGLYASTALQGAAYRAADFYIRGDSLAPMPATDGFLIVHLRPEGYEVVELETGPDVYAGFQALRRAHYVVNGWKCPPPLEPPAERKLDLVVDDDPFVGLP